MSSKKYSTTKYIVALVYPVPKHKISLFPEMFVVLSLFLPFFLGGNAVALSHVKRRGGGERKRRRRTQLAPSSFFSFSSFSSSSSVHPGIQTVPSTMLPPRYATSDALLYYGRRFAYQFASKKRKKNPLALLLCLLNYSNIVPYFFRVMDSRKCPPPMSLPASPALPLT